MRSGDRERVSMGATILGRGAVRLVRRVIDRGGLRRLIAAGSIGAAVARRRPDLAVPPALSMALWPALGNGARRRAPRARLRLAVTAARMIGLRARGNVVRGVVIPARKAGRAKVLTAQGPTSGIAGAFKIRRAAQAAGRGVKSLGSLGAAFAFARRSGSVVATSRSVAPISRGDAREGQKAMIRSGPAKHRPNPPASENAMADFQRSLGNRLVRLGSLPPGTASGFNSRVGPDWHGIGSLS